VLGVRPGPVVGRAYRHLLELRLEHGPMEHDEAVAALKEWWVARGADGESGEGRGEGA
jgi:poly(A) polymerase